MSKRSVALLIFTKSPVEGHVKTRLIPQWGSHGALLLYQDMIKATIEMTQKSSIEDIIIYRTPGDESPFLQSCAIHYELPLMEQHGFNLGDRMHNAIHEHLKTHECVIIIGCDCPELREEELHKTIKGLNSEADIVLGPCEDGGYYLMGMNQEHPELFSGIDWGTSNVMEQTRKRINSLGLNSCELDIKWDVDRPEDVFRYMGRLEHEG